MLHNNCINLCYFVRYTRNNIKIFVILSKKNEYFLCITNVFIVHLIKIQIVDVI